MSVIEPLLGSELPHAALTAAVRAPSPHNTQPWRFEVDSRGIDVFLDPTRVLAVADPDGREARLSCGAAILNARIGLAASARDAAVDLFPDRRHEEFLATVRITDPSRVSAADQALLRAVGHRHTHRRPFTDHPVSAGIRHAMTEAVRAEGAELLLLGHAEVDRVAELVRRAETTQSEDPAFRAELRQWTRTGPGGDDGVPLAAGGPRAEEGSLLSLRRYEDTSAVVRPYERDPLIAVVATHADTVFDHVRAGQAMQRALLVATTAGVSASFLAQPVEIPATRVALRELLGGRLYPQAVLRLGYGYSATVTPRRPLAAVTRPRA